MRDILPELENWLASGQQVALATVIRTWGSSPRRVGAKMALTVDGKITGSVSGGCVEGAVFETGVEVLEKGQPKFLHFGVADETAWEVGLACGGQIDLFVQALEPKWFARLDKQLESSSSFAVATVVRGPNDLLGRKLMADAKGILAGVVHADLDAAIFEKAARALSAGLSRVVDLPAGPTENLAVFIEVVQPQPVLIVVGGVHTAIVLTEIARSMGFRTVVIDPRRAFGSPERFPHIDQLIQAWPQEAFAQLRLTSQTAVAMLTHDPKIDDPALQITLDSPAFYIGALGSPTTQEKRRERLRAAGFREEQLARLHGPIGLELGADTPEEIALSIMAEIVAVKRGGQV